MNVNEKLVLYLNANWMPTSIVSIADAIIAMHSEDNPAMALDIEYEQNEDGSYDFGSEPTFNALEWNLWVNLPIRNYDEYISTSRQRIRVPSIILAPRYYKIHSVRHNPTKNRIFERDNNVCQYTGKKLTKSNRTIDHVLPKSRGGKDTWENQVACHKEINSKKGNRLNKDVGLKLLKTPKAPKSILANALINDIRHRDWKFFIIK